MSEHESATTVPNVENGSAQVSVEPKVIKLKKVQKPKKSPPKKDDKRSTNRSAAQIANQFKPGQSANPAGRPKVPAELKTFRLNCELVLKEKGLPTLVEHLYRPDLSTRDLMAIVTFLADRSYGKAKEVNYNEADDVTPAAMAVPIIIDRKLLEQALRNDQEHFNDED